MSVSGYLGIVQMDITISVILSYSPHITPPIYRHLVAVVGPGPEGEVALLPVKGEVRHVNHT